MENNYGWLEFLFHIKGAISPHIKKSKVCDLRTAHSHVTTLHACMVDEESHVCENHQRPRREQSE